MKKIITFSQKIYAILLNFYPKNYRKAFGKEMEYVYSETIKDAVSEKGTVGIVNFWITSALDAGKSLLNEHFENLKGGGDMKTKSRDIFMDNKIFAWIGAGTAIVLSIPLIGMQFSSEWDWNLFDFIVMGALIFGTGFIFVQVARITPRKYRVLIGIGFLLALLLTWAHLAVGIVDTWPLAGS